MTFLYKVNYAGNLIFLLFLMVSVLYGIFLSMAAVLLEEISFRRYPNWRDLTKLLVFSVVENIGYRQLHVVWRLRGWWQALRGTEQHWGVMTRRGFSTEKVS